MGQVYDCSAHLRDKQTAARQVQVSAFHSVSGWSCPPLPSRSPSYAKRTPVGWLFPKAGCKPQRPPPKPTRVGRAPRWRSLSARCTGSSRTRSPASSEQGRREEVKEAGGDGTRPGPAHPVRPLQEKKEAKSRAGVNETLLKTEHRANQGLQTGMWTRSKTKQKNKQRKKGGRRGVSEGWKGRGSESEERGGERVFFFFLLPISLKNQHRRTHTHTTNVCSRVET